MIKNRYPFISILRILSMMWIVFGHWCSYKNIYIYDMGGVAVCLFLLISGYLCGKAEIADSGQWIIKKFKRLYVPLIVWTIILILIGLLQGNFREEYIPSLFGMCGLSEIFLWVKIASAPEMWQTWYITVTLVCYLLAVMIKNSSVNLTLKRNLKKTLLIVLLVDVLFAYMGVQLSCILQFFIGFYCAEDKYGIELKKQVKVSALLMFLMITIRILSHSLIDNTVLYCRIISPWMKNIICIFIFVFFKYVSTKYEHILSVVANRKVCIVLDKLSYEIYIVHVAFLQNFSNYFNSILPTYLVDIVFLVYVFLSAIFLERISSVIIGKRREVLV